MLAPIKPDRSLAAASPAAAAFLAPKEQIYDRADPNDPNWLSSFSVLENAVRVLGCVCVVRGQVVKMTEKIIVVIS